jgi:hypothetical protein
LYTIRYKKCGNTDKLAYTQSPVALKCAKDERMPISEQLLEILVCPACHAQVELKPDGSGLKCVECKRVYPIRDDIPVMLIDEATIQED